MRASAIKDPKRIDVDDARELAAWCLLLNVTNEELTAAVAAKGPMSAIIAIHLACQRYGKSTKR